MTVIKNKGKVLDNTRRFIRRAIIAANIAIIIIMLFIGYSDRIDPEAFPTLSSVGLLFPLALAANFFFLILWIFIKVRYALLPILGYVVCYFPIRTYCPLNIPNTPPEDVIKVLSYNVLFFDNIAEDDTMTSMDYIRDCGADIVCIQEGVIDRQLEDCLGGMYQYIDSISLFGSTNSVLLLSRFPILKKERIEYPSAGNLSGAFYLKTDYGTILVINNHFETHGFSKKERENFRMIVHGDAEKDTLRAESRRLVEKIGESARKRAPQADAVAEYIRRHKDYKIILCGDFNDSPISYTHRTISKELIDCYVESGNGPGWSYNQNSMKVRIDNIFCSDDWVPYNCNVDRKIKASDHYPVVCWLKIRNNQ